MEQNAIWSLARVCNVGNRFLLQDRCEHPAVSTLLMIDFCFVKKDMRRGAQSVVLWSALLVLPLLLMTCFDLGLQMRRRLEERLTSKCVQRHQERVMHRWGTLARCVQRLKGMSDGAYLKGIWKCKICALTHWRVVCKHGRAVQRSVLLCRPE